MKYSKSKKSGFTLVELIVVLTILAILAALLIPALTGYIEKAKKNKVIAETRMLHEAVQTVTSELYAGSAQWKVSKGGSATLASSSGDPVKASSALAGVNLILLSSMETEKSIASFILLEDTWDCIVPIPNNMKHINSVKRQITAQ